ncbi:MAG TPA: DUF1697 domain-containing protein [Nocardioides sp.]|nr:DUF1697 domain-containing protein [Nocardioides sp.]
MSTTYVAFLRAINLGPNRKFPKGDIVAATEAAGCVDVQTYINTGNVLLSSTLATREEVEAALEESYRGHIGFEVPTIVFTAEEFAGVAAGAAELHTDDLERHYVNLLKEEPAPEKVAELEARSTDAEKAVVRGRAAHVLIGSGYQPGRVDPFNAEKTLGVVATNRNFNVVTTVAQRWCSQER